MNEWTGEEEDECARRRQASKNGKNEITRVKKREEVCQGRKK